MFLYIRAANNYDYKTGTASGTDVIDVTKTGTSYYDNFLNDIDAEYMRSAKNRRGEIVNMTPAEYYQSCADFFEVSVDHLMAERKYDAEQIEYLKDVILKDKKKFPLPYIDFTHGQEGLHRMMALGEIFGYDDVAFPVLVVDVDDEYRETVWGIRDKFSRAIDKAREYAFNIDDIESEFAQEINYQLDARSEDNELVCIASKRDTTLPEDDQSFEIWIDGYEDDTVKTIWLSQLRLAEPEEIEPDDLDDIDDLLDEDDIDIASYLLR